MVTLPQPERLYEIATECHRLQNELHDRVTDELQSELDAANETFREEIGSLHNLLAVKLMQNTVNAKVGGVVINSVCDVGIHIEQNEKARFCEVHLTEMGFDWSDDVPLAEVNASQQGWTPRVLAAFGLYVTADEFRRQCIEFANRLETMKRIECFGGPLDGEKHDVPEFATRTSLQSVRSGISGTYQQRAGEPTKFDFVSGEGVTNE